uniref:Uncharacterized protein n=1 Tax=Opuntia streptacantha TaxID=393608 RepID=A0A7C9CEN6_OPUST
MLRSVIEQQLIEVVVFAMQRVWSQILVLVESVVKHIEATDNKIFRNKNHSSNQNWRLELSFKICTLRLSIVGKEVLQIFICDPQTGRLEWSASGLSYSWRTGLHPFGFLVLEDKPSSCMPFS